MSSFQERIYTPHEMIMHHMNGLTQRVEIDRNYIVTVRYYLLAVQRELVRRAYNAEQRLSTTEALSLAALERLVRKVDQACESLTYPAPENPAPLVLEVAFDELAVVRFYYARMMAAAAAGNGNYYLGKGLHSFHLASMPVEAEISLAPTIGPVSETIVADVR